METREYVGLGMGDVIDVKKFDFGGLQRRLRRKKQTGKAKELDWR